MLHCRHQTTSVENFKTSEDFVSYIFVNLICTYVRTYVRPSVRPQIQTSTKMFDIVDVPNFNVVARTIRHKYSWIRHRSLQKPLEIPFATSQGNRDCRWVNDRLKTFLSDVDVLLEEDDMTRFFKTLTSQDVFNRSMCLENLHFYYLPLVGVVEDDRLYDLLLLMLQEDSPTVSGPHALTASMAYCYNILMKVHLHRKIATSIVKVLAEPSETGQRAVRLLLRAAVRSTSIDTVNLGKVTIRVVVDAGETAFMELASKLNIKPMKLPLYDAFERLSDEALESTLSELEILVPRLAADPVSVIGKCELPSYTDLDNGHCYPKGARTLCGNGMMNVAYCSGSFSYSRFRQIFLQGRADINAKGKEEEEEDDTDARVTYMISKLSVLPCKHVRELVASAFRLREDLAGWMSKDHNFTTAMPPAILKICMESDVLLAVHKYFSSCDSSWYDYASFQNPVSFVLHSSHHHTLKSTCSLVVSMMASRSVEVAYHLAKYFAVADVSDAEKLIDCELRELKTSNNRHNTCLIPALAIVERLCRESKWESVLKNFMKGRSDELLETVTLLGSMSKGDAGNIRSVSEVLEEVERTLPAFDSELAEHALRYWNPGTVAMVLNKIPKSDLERYMTHVADEDNEDVTDKTTLIVVALYLLTDSVSVTHRAVQLQLNADLMFARCRLDCFEEPPSEDSWHDMVDENYSYLLENLITRWP